MCHAKKTAHTDLYGIFAYRDSECKQGVAGTQLTWGVDKYALRIGCLVFKPSCNISAVQVLHT